MYCYRQIDRNTGAFLGYISYENREPTNNDPAILLEPISEADFSAALEATAAESEETEGPHDV